MTWTSTLSAADAAALRGVGLEPVGHAFGVSVYHVGFAGTAYCGGVEPGRAPSETWRTPRAAGEWSGFGATVAAMRNVRRRALDRLVSDATTRGADGVVDIALHLEPYAGAPHALECSAWGTAVRAVGDVRPARPFLAAVSAVDVAALLRAGWTPVGIALGVAVEIEHHDGPSRAVTGVRGIVAGNAEVPAVTRLVQRTRAEARRTLDGELTRMGADGAVVSSMSLDVHDDECHVYERLRDHVAESVVVATGIARFADNASLLPPARRRRGRRPATGPAVLPLGPHR